MAFRLLLFNCAAAAGFLLGLAACAAGAGQDYIDAYSDDATVADQGDSLPEDGNGELPPIDADDFDAAVEDPLPLDLSDGADDQSDPPVDLRDGLDVWDGLDLGVDDLLADRPDEVTAEDSVFDSTDTVRDFTDPDLADPDAADLAEELPSSEVWIEINYRYRSPSESPQTADWSYSSTPGWTASNWAPQGSSWSYINAPDGDSLVSDPIGGTVLELGCSHRFRLFFGLEELSSVGSAQVTLEGRSRSTSASVDFEVWNPGASSSIVATGSMSNDWTADVVTVEFTAEAGNGFQAVEISPTARSCDLALRRVRLTLHDIH